MADKDILRTDMSIYVIQFHDGMIILFYAPFIQNSLNFYIHIIYTDICTSLQNYIKLHAIKKKKPNAFKQVSWIHVSAELSYGDLVMHFDYVWLRDHCRSSSCYNSKTNQRNLDTASIELDIKPSKSRSDENNLYLTCKCRTRLDPVSLKIRITSVQ